MTRRAPPFAWLAMPLAVLATLATKSACAEIDAIDTPLDQLVEMRIISMPKFAENADAIPSVVSIIKREDIRIYGWRTLGEALRSLQGFNVTSNHAYEYAGTRGISLPGDFRPRLQLLIDGTSLNDSVFSSAPIEDSFPLDLDLVERIEVVRGPSASVYGGDAMFGVINVVTRSGQGMAGGEASVSVGSGKEQQGRLSWGGMVGSADVMVSASGFDSDGQSLRFDDVGASAHGVGAENGKRFFLRARGSDWRLTLINGERKAIVPTGRFGTRFDDKGLFAFDRYSLVDLAKEWQLGAHATLQQRLYVGDYTHEGQFPYDYSQLSPSDPRVINRDRMRGQWWGFDNHLVVTGLRDQRLTFGLEYRSDSRQDQENTDLGYGCYPNKGSSACLDDRRSAHQLAAFVQDEIQVGPATLFTAGLRHDWTSVSGSHWSPRLGLVHDAGQPGIFKALWGTAYRSPSVDERYYSPAGFPPYGNPGLRSEKMKSLEFAWEKSLGQAARLTSSLYAFQVDGMIRTDAQGMASNDTAVHARGFEVEYEKRWSGDLRLRANYSVQRAQDEAGSLDNSPRHMLKANLAAPTGLPYLNAGAEAQWVAARKAASGSEEIGAYTLVNLNLLYVPPGERWDLALGIYNVFDHRYYDPVAESLAGGLSRWASPQLGRSLRLKATLRF